MPLGTFKRVGDFSKKGSFEDEADRRILSNPAIVERIREKFAGIPQTIDMYFVNVPGETGVRVTRELGRISVESAIEFLPRGTSLNPEAITVIYTNNAADDKVPMTPWIIAHRLGHAFRSGQREKNPAFIAATASFEAYITRIGICAYDIQRYDEEDITMLCMSLLTFRSARQGMLRNYREAIYEVLAQYMTTGKIELNPLPTHIGDKEVADDKEKLEETDILMHSLKVKVEEGFKQALEFAVGKIWLI